MIANVLDPDKFTIRLKRILKYIPLVIGATWYLATVYVSVTNTNELVTKSLTPMVMQHEKDLAILDQMHGISNK